jgi:single-strand DNA-binding protein
MKNKNMNLNKAMVIGNLTRDPEVKNTPSGQTVATFSVATSFSWTDQSGQKKENVEFHNIVAWRRLAEICGQYLKKGSKVYIEGRLQTRNWQDKNTGAKMYRTEIIAENMIMLSSSQGGAGNFSQGQSSPRGNFNVPRPGNSYEQPGQSSEPVIDIDSPTYNPVGANGDEEEIKVENIPF